MVAPTDEQQVFTEMTSWRGPHDSAKHYKPGDAVSYGGGAYLANKFIDPGGAVPTTATADWDILIPPPGVASHPNLATHDTMGLATQTEFEAHSLADIPHTKQISAGKLAADLPSTYNTGISYHDGTTANGWPANGTVITVKHSASRTIQYQTEAQGSGVAPRTRARNAVSASEWNPWALLHDDLRHGSTGDPHTQYALDSELALYMKKPVTTERYYVSLAGSDANDGLSWGTAKATIAGALAIATVGAKIELGDGTFPADDNLGLRLGTELFGQGADRTTIQLNSANFANFGFGYIVEPFGQDKNQGHVRVHDLTIDGNYQSGLGALNQGGLMMVGHYWSVFRVKFKNPNYFGVWVKQVTGVTMDECEWYGPGRGNDNIGGGPDSHDVTIRNSYYDASVTGNAFDLNAADDGTSVTGFTLQNWQIKGDNAIYFEGITDSVIDNIETHGAISVQSNVGYVVNAVVNPKNVRVLNSLIDFEGTGGSTGLMFKYSHRVGELSFTTGGGNMAIGNTLRNLPKWGILIHGDVANDIKTRGDILIGNQITNTNMDGANTANGGYGVFEQAGIVLGYGKGDVVVANKITDDQAVPTTRYGIAIMGTSVGARVYADAEIGPNSILNTTLGKYVFGTSTSVQNLHLIGGSSTTAGRPAAAMFRDGSMWYDTDLNQPIWADGGTWQTLPVGGGGGSVATDTIWDAKGDLAFGSAANTAIRKAIGANGTILVADSADATGAVWRALLDSDIPATIARDSELPDLAGHLADATDAHDASAISYAGGTGMSAVDVEAAIDELATEKSDISHTHTRKFEKAVVVLNPTAAINVIVWRAPYAATLLNVRGYRVGGTGATVNARRNGSGTKHLAAALSLTAADTWADGGAVQDATYASGDKLEAMIVSVAGAPAQVAIEIDFQRTE